MFMDGEVLAFEHVGRRRYIRGLDIVTLLEARIPDFDRLDLKFLRPLAERAVIRSTRCSGIAVAVSITPSMGDPVELFIINLEAVTQRPLPEPPLVPHLALPRRGRRHDYIVFGRRTHADILAMVFHRFQAAVSRHFVLRSLRLERAPAAIVERISLMSSSREQILQSCAITRRGRPWCQIEMIGSQAMDMPS